MIPTAGCRDSPGRVASRSAPHEERHHARRRTMRTAIFNGKANTTLIIQTSEAGQLVQMGVESKPISLNAGQNSVVVGAGVFKLVSKTGVSVSSPDLQPAFEIQATADDKDGDWPDPQKSLVTIGASTQALHQFFTTGARSL
jgi:hypothetical protein